LDLPHLYVSEEVQLATNTVNLINWPLKHELSIKIEAFDQSVLQQALDIVKHSKVGNLLVGEERRKSAKTSRRGSRESLEMSYDGDEVGDGA